MRCERARETLEDLGRAEVPAWVREHVASCAACQAWARDWRLIRAGLRLLAREPVPGASPGFAARLARKLEGLAAEGARSGEFWERAGRQFVYATLVLALATLLALLLPSSGPLRGPTTAELYAAGPEAVTLGNDPIFPDELPANPTPAAGSLALPGSETNQR